MFEYKCVKIQGDLLSVAKEMNENFSKNGWELIAVEPLEIDTDVLLKRKIATAAKTKGCRVCFGSGGKKSNPCVVCGGTGRVTEI
jgi:hypothetical protein